MPAKIHNHDDLLIKMLSVNDRKAINILYKKHYKHLLQIIVGLIQDKDDAQDIVQDLFVDLWLKRHSLNITKPIAAYLIKAAVHRSLNYIRNNSRHKTYYFRETGATFYLKSDLPPNAPMELDELKRAIRSATQKLPPRCKTAFILKTSFNMSYNEIAVHMGVTKKAVEKQISKAVRKLKIDLGQYMKIFLFIM